MPLHSDPLSRDEEFCRKLCEKHGLAQVCSCEDCRHAREDKRAMSALREAVRVTREEAAKRLLDHQPCHAQDSLFEILGCSCGWDAPEWAEWGDWVNHFKEAL